MEMTGTGSTSQPGTAIPGDSLTSDELKFSINVKKHGATGASPNGYKLEILKNGVSVDSATVSVTTSPTATSRPRPPAATRSS